MSKSNCSDNLSEDINKHIESLQSGVGQSHFCNNFCAEGDENIGTAFHTTDPTDGNPAGIIKPASDEVCPKGPNNCQDDKELVPFDEKRAFDGEKFDTNHKLAGFCYGRNKDVTFAGRHINNKNKKKLKN